VLQRSAAVHRSGCDPVGDRGLINWSELVGIDTDIDHAAVLSPSFVNVPMEQPRALVDRSVVDEAVVLLTVASIGEVTENGLGPSDLDLLRSLNDLIEAGIEIALCPPLGSSTVPGPAAIVVAGNEDLAAAQFCDQRERFGDLAQREVADDPDGVVLGYGLVPVVNQSAIHRIDVSERTVAVVDDVGVAEVEVGGEPSRHGEQDSMP